MFNKILLILIVVSSMLQSYDIHQYDVNRNSSSNNGGYQGDSGQRYQYDMNSPSDRIDYSYDLDAQRRDSQYDYSGNVNRDRSYGQYGAGRYDD